MYIQQDSMYFKLFKKSQDKRVSNYLNRKLGRQWDDGHLADHCAKMTDDPSKYKYIIDILNELET